MERASAPFAEVTMTAALTIALLELESATREFLNRTNPEMLQLCGLSPAPIPFRHMLDKALEHINAVRTRESVGR
jgi:hypothetical protein